MQSRRSFLQSGAGGICAFSALGALQTLQIFEGSEVEAVQFHVQVTAVEQNGQFMPVEEISLRGVEKTIERGNFVQEVPEGLTAFQPWDPKNLPQVRVRINRGPELLRRVAHIDAGAGKIWIYDHNGPFGQQPIWMHVQA